ncbi:transposase, partial [Polaribacter glomeratus]
MFTPANVDDRFPLKRKNFNAKLIGKIFGSKDYIGKGLFERLFGLN